MSGWRKVKEAEIKRLAADGTWGLKVAGICGFGCGFAGLRHLVAKKSMMTQGGDLLHSGLGYEKEGLVRALLTKAEHNHQPKQPGFC